MAGKITNRIFCFGPFEVDETAGELRKQGVRIKLHSHPFQVLLMLIEKQSEPVFRDELRQRLWGDETFVDFDHGLKHRGQQAPPGAWRLRLSPSTRGDDTRETLWFHRTRGLL